MKFFIMGDSWGVGEWELENGKFKSIPDTGTDYHLQQLGHQVTNISAGSAGNFGQLRHAYWTLKNNSDYDYIIWFYTETMRDIQEIVINDPEEAKIQFPKFKMLLNLEDTISYMDRQNYQYAQSMYNEYQIPFIIIEGQSRLPQIINEFSFVAHVIPWLKELLNLDFLPPSNTFFSWQKIQRILTHFNIDEKKFIIENLDELDKSKIIIELAKASKLFPDDAHPGSLCHKQLANRIVNWVHQ